MRIVKRTIAILGGFGLALTQGGNPAEARFEQCERTVAGLSQPKLRAEAECACEEALLEDTIEALEDYLDKYPFAPTACRALALNALLAFEPNSNDPNNPPNNPPNGPPSGGPGYGA